MNDQERIEVLESMLTEERGNVSIFITVIESYARGLEMMARVMYGESLAGSRDEENARAIKQHSSNMSIELGVRVAELRGMMGRVMPSGEEEAPSPPADEDDLSALPFIREDGLADPSVPAENIDQSQAVTIH